MVTLGSLKFVLTLARLYIKPPLGEGTPTLGDRGGPSLSRFLHTVSSATISHQGLLPDSLCWRLSDGLVTRSLMLGSRSNIDRFLPTCVQHRRGSVGCPEYRRTMIETLTVARSTSLSPARQCHGGWLIPTLHWMLAHPPLPVTPKICGAYPALGGMLGWYPKNVPLDYGRMVYFGFGLNSCFVHLPKCSGVYCYPLGFLFPHSGKSFGGLELYTHLVYLYSGVVH